MASAFHVCVMSLIVRLCDEPDRWAEEKGEELFISTQGVRRHMPGHPAVQRSKRPPHRMHRETTFTAFKEEAKTGTTYTSRIVQHTDTDTHTAFPAAYGLLGQSAVVV